MLVNKEDTLRLPALTIAGRSRYYLHIREGEEDWPSPALYKASKNLTVLYQLQLRSAHGWEKPSWCSLQNHADAAASR